MLFQMFSFNGKQIHLNLHLLISYTFPKTQFLWIVPTGPSSRITDVASNIGQYNDKILYTKGSKIFL